MLPISRRTFLGAATLSLTRSTGPGPLLDPGSGCILRESLAGFRAVMADGHIGLATALVVPGAGVLNQRCSGAIQGHLMRGGSVLLESALGLYAQRIDSPYFPYVDFIWPVRARIREFCPLHLAPAPGDTVIATFGGKPAALRREVGRGTLILLGSPVGPALLSADPDARRWVAGVLRWMHTHSENPICSFQRVNPMKSISRKPTTRS